MRSLLQTTITMAILMCLAGCSSQDIPQAHKGRMFDKTGVAAFYSGGHGFEGSVLPPGTYYTGLYPEIRMLDCSTRTIKEPLPSMTKDGVQFKFDVFVTFNANCDDDNAVDLLLQKLAPLGTVDSTANGAGNAGSGDDKDPVETEPARTITSRQIYNTYVRPALGEAVRAAIAGYDANDINSHRDDVFKKISEKLNADLNKDPKSTLIVIGGLNLGNPNLPDEMAAAAADRATQQVLKDKSLAEQDRIKVETDTAKLKVAQSQAEAQQEAAKIDVVGAALHRNPEYYVRDVYFYAADKGGSVMLPSNPSAILQMTPGHH